jgi:hypothetical protein
VTNPDAETVATPVFEDRHIATDVTSCCWEPLVATVAVNWPVVPISGVRDPPVIVTGNIVRVVTAVTLAD